MLAGLLQFKSPELLFFFFNYYLLILAFGWIELFEMDQDKWDVIMSMNFLSPNIILSIINN